MKNKPYQTGMTLIEIMIALLIGAFLLGGVLQIFTGSKETNKMQEGLSRLQENARFAMDLLAKDIRMAGFLGCNSRTPPTNTLNSPTDFLNRFNNAIEGFESISASAWSPAISAEITSPLGGSDVITIRRASDQSFTVTAQTAATVTLDNTATTTNLKTAGFLKSDGTNNCAIAVASDCSGSAVFQVTGVWGTTLINSTIGGCAPNNSTINLGKTYVGGQVSPINTISYYVRTGPGGQPSLYRRIGANNAEELVEGIEQMQVWYGIDTDDNDDGDLSTPQPDGPANYYVTANNIPGAPDWHRIVSIRISLLAASIDDNLTAQPVPYTFNGAPPVTPTDRKIRRVFNTTIAVRNRLP